ncbi:DHH family phosphoesterase, partial [Candidatus Uhrbacteria bacterium]|nr:DHH family phosphoesterase [Candidatus Uhrbacteria bacterium]
MHPVVEALLEKRGVSIEERAAFLSPDFQKGVHDPFLFLRMKVVCERLFLAMERGERVVIHGDYDADGLCGSALLVSALKTVAQRANWKLFLARLTTYVPSREGDGYGLSMNAVRQFAGGGVDVIVTVDCGVANVEEIQAAYEAGMEVIVVDHHQLASTIPERALIIHPLIPGEMYPFTYLSAVGVAYKVACALYETARAREIAIPKDHEKWLLDLVAIATVTDMVPLVAENRVLETFGLLVLAKTRRVGLQALKTAVGLEGKHITTEDVGFRLGPRLNAPGRLGNADLALQLLLCENREEAERLAELL